MREGVEGSECVSVYICVKELVCLAVEHAGTSFLTRTHSLCLQTKMRVNAGKEAFDLGGNAVQQSLHAIHKLRVRATGFGCREQERVEFGGVKRRSGEGQECETTRSNKNKTCA